MEFHNVSWREWLLRGEDKDLHITISWSYTKSCFVVVKQTETINTEYYINWEDTKNSIPKPNNLDNFDEKITRFVVELVAVKL